MYKHKRFLPFLVGLALNGQVIFQAAPQPPFGPTAPRILLQATPCSNGQWILEFIDTSAGAKPILMSWNPSTNAITSVPYTLPGDKTLTLATITPLQQDVSLSCNASNGMTLYGLMFPGGSGNLPIASSAPIVRLLPGPTQVLLDTQTNTPVQFTEPTGKEALLFGGADTFYSRGSKTIGLVYYGSATQAGTGILDVGTAGTINTVLFDFPRDAVTGSGAQLVTRRRDMPCFSDDALWFAEGDNAGIWNFYRAVSGKATAVFNTPIVLSDPSLTFEHGSYACNATGAALAYKDTGQTKVVVIDEQLRITQRLQSSTINVHGLAMKDDGTILLAADDGLYLLTPDGKSTQVLALNSLPAGSALISVLNNGESFGVPVQSGIYLYTLGGFIAYKAFTLYVAHLPKVPDVVKVAPGETQLTISCSDCFGSVQATLGGTLAPVSASSGGSYVVQIPASLRAGTYPLTLTFSGDLQSKTTVTSQVSIGTPLTITTMTLPEATAGATYATTLAASGGTPPYSWAVAAGSNLPMNLSLSSDGKLAGIATKSGAFTFSVIVTDAEGQKTTQQYVLQVADDRLPLITAAGIVNASSGQFTNLVAGEWITIYGQHLSSSTASAASVPFPTVLAGTQVLINSQPVPLWYVGPGQVNAFVPSELSGSTATLQVVTKAGDLFLRSATLNLSLSAQSPGLSLFNGDAIIISGHGLITPDNPLQDGDEVTLYGTGFGSTIPSVGTNQAAPSGPLAMAVATVGIRIGGHETLLRFAGLSPGSYGLFQINARVALPEKTTIASQHVIGVLTVGDQSLNFNTWY
jgi:uncharacterized protein (TIGR03437 family)